MNTNTTTSCLAVEPKYLSSKGLIAFLQVYAGYTLSRSSLYKLTMDSQIPHKKGPGGRLLFPIDAIKQWVEGGSEGGAA